MRNTHNHRAFHQQENLFHAIASRPTEDPWIMEITSDLTIINIYVSHISLMPLFCQSHVPLLWFHADSADSILFLCLRGPTHASVGTSGLTAPRLLAYF